jgi:hypothetical protein
MEIYNKRVRMAAAAIPLLVVSGAYIFLSSVSQTFCASPFASDLRYNVFIDILVFYSTRSNERFWVHSCEQGAQRNWRWTFAAL